MFPSIKKGDAGMAVSREFAPADRSQDAANSLFVSINSLFCAIKFPVPISRELYSNKLILLRSVGRSRSGPIFLKFPVIFPVSREFSP